MCRHPPISESFRATSRGYPIAAAGSGPYLFVGSTNSAGVHPAGSNKWIGYGFDSPCFGERVYSVALEAPPGSN